jgi:hypothetical protein
MNEFSQVGRGRITALAALIATLTGAGLVAGCSSHAASPSPTPTVIITKTVAAAPASASAPASAAASAPASAAGDPATPGASGAAATAGNGAQVGAYSFQLTNGYAAPLGPTAPTQSQMIAAGSGGSYDIAFNGDILPGSDETMIALPNGSTPTYSACTTGTAFIQYAPLDKGTAFCILETSGQVAGVVLSAVDSSPTSAILKATIWKDAS